MTWPDVSSTSGYDNAASGYNVVYSTDHKHSWTRTHTNHTGTTATIANTDDNATYYVAVQAVNTTGTSNWTNSTAIPPTTS